VEETEVRLRQLQEAGEAFPSAQEDAEPDDQDLNSDDEASRIAQEDTESECMGDDEESETS